RIALTVPLKDRALSVSGRAEKSFERDGVVYSHIMDPRTARPVQGILGVAVLTSTGTSGDALDDALFVQGVEGSRAYLQPLPAGARARPRSRGRRSSGGAGASASRRPGAGRSPPPCRRSAATAARP